MNKYRYWALSAALILIVTSACVWTLIVRHYVLTAMLDTLPSAPQSDGLQDTHPAAPDHLQSQSSESLQSDASSADAVSSDSSAPETSSAENELAQWGIRRAWAISIPSLGLRAPVYLPSMKFWAAKSWDMLEDQMQVGLRYGTVAYPHSVSPGSEGALIIAGHSSPPNAQAAASPYNRIFAALGDLKSGDKITIFTGNASVRYRVESREVVSPDATSILSQDLSQGSLLKLITCYPIGTTRSRLIVIARQVGDEAE